MYRRILIRNVILIFCSIKHVPQNIDKECDSNILWDKTCATEY